MKKLILAAVALFAVTALQAKVTLQSGSADFMNDADATANLTFDFEDCIVVSFQAGKVSKDFGSLYDYLSSQQLEKEKTIPQSSGYDMARAQFNKANKKGLKLVASDQAIESHNKAQNPDPSLSAKDKKKLQKADKWLTKYGCVWDKSNVKYDIIVHADTISAGSAGAAAMFGGSMIPGADGGSAMIGWVEVIDRASHDVICEARIGKFYGQGSFAFQQRFWNVLGACVAKELPDLKKLVEKKK